MSDIIARGMAQKNKELLADIAINVKHPPTGLIACKGDGVTDDSTALRAIFNYALTQYANGITVTISVPAGNYVVNSSIVVDGNQNVNTTTSRFHLKMAGFFTSPNGIGKTLSFKNLTGCDFDIKIKGLNHTTDHNIYSTDLSANVVGLDVALYVENCSYTKLDFYCSRFFGRGIEAYNCSTSNFGNIRGDLVGQMIYVNSTSGFGSIGDIWVTEYMGSYFKATDLTIKYYENMILNTSVKKGITFDTCSSVWVDVMNVGNNSDAYEVNILSCSNMNISSMYIYGKNTSPTDYCSGLYIFQSYALNIVLNTAYIYGDALHIVGIKGSYIKVIDTFSQNIGTITTTSTYGVSQTTLEIYSRYRTGTGLTVQKGSGGQTVDSLNISINAKDRDASNANATDLTVVDSDSNVKIMPATTANTISLPTTNAVTNASSTTSSFTNPPLNDSTVKLIITTPTTALTGFALKSSWSNKVVRQNYVVSGSVALTCATNNGNVNSGDVICTFDKNQGPLSPVIFAAMLKLADGTIKMLDVDAEWSSTGTLIKAMSSVATANIVNITLNFSYECQQ